MLDLKSITGSTKGYTLPPGVYEVIDINILLESLLPKEVKVSITSNNLGLKSNLTNSKTIRSTKKSFFIQYKVLTKVIQVN